MDESMQMQTASIHAAELAKSAFEAAKYRALALTWAHTIDLLDTYLAPANSLEELRRDMPLLIWAIHTLCSAMLDQTPSPEPVGTHPAFARISRRDATRILREMRDGIVDERYEKLRRRCANLLPEVA
ncbi:MAG TPA: hypothetical protein VJP85_05635 [Candidatus Baltobacteraceae bacterium]|nr:hypothetical protein [Candidatus Baltobacteraceae bacterium]